MRGWSTDMGTLKGFASPFGPPPATPTPLASLGLAIPPAMVHRRRSRRASHATRLAELFFRALDKIQGRGAW